MSKILIIVDMQNDFCLESGSLYVKGATPALWNIEELMYKEHFDRVWFTVDWHAFFHPSFKENGGEWPVHCVQYSQGAAINDLLLTACRNNNLRYDVIEKGLFKEEYGAFPDLKRDPNRKSHYTYSLDDIYDSRADIYLSNESEVVICGVAGDYCVLNTIKNLEPIWDRLSIFLPGIASIDGGTALQEFIKENKLNIYQPIEKR